MEATGSAGYRGAFAKLCSDPERGHLLWTSEEADAFRVAAAFHTQYRALGEGTGGAGGYLVPYQLDPSILLTSDGSVSPLRRIARVVRTVSNEWRGVSSAGVSAEWKAENAEAADASPSFGQPTIKVHAGDASVPYSFEVGEDAGGFVSELQRLLVDAAGQLQAAAFANGSGNGEPNGVVTALTGSASEISAGTAGAVDAADVVAVQDALGARFQPRAQWIAPLSVLNSLGGLETANGSLRFPAVESGRLLRKPINEASELPGPGDGATAGAALAYGDFRAGVTIVDRIGTTVELVPHLFGANHRPTGQRGLYMRFRTGADVVVPNALRLLTS
ncbi:MAG: phage major capsid protein [Nocardioidaceae bacterium]